MVSYFQAALAGLHGKQIRASGFGRGSNKQGGVKETRGGQRKKGGGQINRGGSKKQGGGQKKRRGSNKSGGVKKKGSPGFMSPVC